MSTLRLCFTFVQNYLFLTILMGLAESRSTVPPSVSPLVVVSFDAFRPDYLDRGLTPHLNEFRQSGVRAEYMRNVFPTKTFPNHFSIATGLYAGAHGVTGNKVFDSKLGRELSYSYELFHQNQDVLPIWVGYSKGNTVNYFYYYFIRLKCILLYVGVCIFADGCRKVWPSRGMHDVARRRFFVR